MKTIRNPLTLIIIRINEKNMLSKLWQSLIMLHVFMMALAIPQAYAEEPYRFDQAWPKL